MKWIPFYRKVLSGRRSWALHSIFKSTCGKQLSRREDSPSYYIYSWLFTACCQSTQKKTIFEYEKGNIILVFLFSFWWKINHFCWKPMLGSLFQVGWGQCHVLRKTGARQNAQGWFSKITSPSPPQLPWKPQQLFNFSIWLLRANCKCVLTGWI